MTVPFSAARTAAPSGASMLMPWPLLAMKSVMTLPETGQRNLSAPDICGSAAGALGATVGVGVTTDVSVDAMVVAFGAAGTVTCVLGAVGASTGAIDAIFTVAGPFCCRRSGRPGMMTFWPT